MHSRRQDIRAKQERALQWSIELTAESTRVGLIITDDCEVLLVDWHDGIANGKYFSTDGNKYVYGSIR